MPNTYKDFVIKGVVEEDKENGGNKIVTPFVRYMEQVWCEGVDVTYSYRTDPKLLGKTCVLFVQVIDEHPTLPSEVDTAVKYANTLGISKVNIEEAASAELATQADKDKVTLINANYKPVLAVAIEEPIVDEIKG